MISELCGLANDDYDRLWLFVQCQQAVRKGERVSHHFLFAPITLIVFAAVSCVTPSETNVVEGGNRWSIGCEVNATITDDAFLAYPISCVIKNLAPDTPLKLAMGEAPAPEGFTFLGQERIDELFRTRSSLARSVLGVGLIPAISDGDGSDGGSGIGRLILLGAATVMYKGNQIQHGFKAEKKHFIKIPPGQKQMLHLVLESKDKSNLSVKPPPALTLCFVKPSSTCSNIELVDPFAIRRRDRHESNDLANQADAASSEAIARKKNFRAAHQVFVNGKLHMSVMFGLGAQLGYRLTAKDAISLSYDYDWWSSLTSISFLGGSYQRFFGTDDLFFVQTGIGILDRQWRNSVSEDLERQYVGLATNLIVGLERQLSSGVTIGLDFGGVYLGPRGCDYFCGGLLPKFRIGHSF